MAQENKTILRTMLLAIYAGLILLLIPWLPVAIWCGAFVFGDPMPEDFGALFFFAKSFHLWFSCTPSSWCKGLYRAGKP
jgi:hypothetical protein